MTIEREIASALSIDPSPEFVARVRARVAHEPQPADRRLTTAFTAAGLATIAIVTTLSFARVDRPGDSTPTVAFREVTSLESVRPPIVTTSNHVPDVRGARKTDAQVMVSTTAAEGLTRLFAAISDGRVDLTQFPTDATYVMVESPRGETIVGPMSVEAIPPITDSEGVRQ